MTAAEVVAKRKIERELAINAHLNTPTDPYLALAAISRLPKSYDSIGKAVAIARRTLKETSQEADPTGKFTRSDDFYVYGVRKTQKGPIVEWHVCQTIKGSVHIFESVPINENQDEQKAHETACQLRDNFNMRRHKIQN